MLKKGIILVFLMLFLFSSIAVFAGGQQEAAEDKEKIVKIGLAVEPASLDLHDDTTTAAMNVTQAIYESLIRYDENMELQPWLAKDFEQLDEVTFRFWLREGIEFHSGNPFNAEAVKAHFDRMLNPDDLGVAAVYANWIEKVVVVDEYTVDIIAGEPHGPALSELANAFNGIQDAKEAEELGDNFGVNPSGTGPFEYVDWSRGSDINLKANENYWGGRPAVDGLQFRIIPGDATRTMAIQTGEIDVTTQLPPEAIPRLQEDEGVNLIMKPEPRYIRWQVNLTHPILRDINVRRALTYAIDYERIVDAILGDYGRPLGGYHVPSQLGYLELPYEYDPEEADSLLRDSGWSKNSSGIYEKDGEELNLEIRTGDKMARELELFEGMQSNFKEFGIAIDIDLIEGSQIYGGNIIPYTKVGVPPGWDEVDKTKDELYQEMDYALLTMDGGARTGEATLSRVFGSDGIRNCMAYSNPDFDEAIVIAEGKTGLTREERVDYYHEAQRILHEDLPTIHLWQPSWAIAVKNSVKNFTLHPFAVWYYEDIEMVD